MRCRFLVAGLLCVLAACNKPKPDATEAKPVETKTAGAPTAAPARPVPDACTLLTSDEIKSVLGEAVQEAKPSANQSGEVAMSQCYFALPTAVNSAVLNVISRRDMRSWWEETFHREHPERENERDAEKGEKKTKPEKVEGVGNEAFWTATAVGGVLYVLNADVCLRVSVGGRDDNATKLKKCVALAQIALKRL